MALTWCQADDNYKDWLFISPGRKNGVTWKGGEK